MESNYWDDQLKKFREAKKKSAIFEELLAVAENILGKLKSVQSELNLENERLKAEVKSLQQNNKELRDELDIAWTQNGN